MVWSPLILGIRLPILLSEKEHPADLTVVL